MLASSLKRKYPAKPRVLIAAIRKSSSDASSPPNLSIMLLITSESTGFFLFTGRLLVLLAHSIIVFQQALSNILITEVTNHQVTNHRMQTQDQRTH